jgi:hypothetical protein
VITSDIHSQEGIETPSLPSPSFCLFNIRYMPDQSSLEAQDSSLNTTSSSNTTPQVRDRTRHIYPVNQMPRRNHQPTPTNPVRNITKRQRLLAGEIRDFTSLLEVPRVAVQHHTRDPILHRSRKTLDRGDHNGCALAVAARHDDRVRALGSGQVEQALGFAVRSASGSLGEGVGAYTREVWAADALTGDGGGAVEGFEA